MEERLYMGLGYERQFGQWYAECMKYIDPEKHITDRAALNVTMVVTKACNFACSYCYQHGKKPERMSATTAREIVDFLLSDRINNYVEPEKTPCVILDFIGGEPLLEIDIIDEFMDYFVYEAFRLNHRWAVNYAISMSSNGALYETPKVQQFIQKYRGRAHIGITIDGTKAQHDSCRVYPDGRGTYDDVERNVKLYLGQGGHPATKVTVSPENMPYLCESALHLFGLGYIWVHCNVQFENVWNIGLAKDLYVQLRTLADKMIEGGYYKNHSISMFDESIGKPMPESDNQNWCGGDGSMLAFDPQGNCYPCMRYIDYCLSVSGRKPFCIGNTKDGIVNRENSPMLTELKSINRKSQSTEECWTCPVAKGCNWCTAFNYDCFGTPNKRATFHCKMQRARVLGNVYFWNRLYRYLGLSKRFTHHMPDEWALEIIDQNEVNLLKELSQED